jgi:DNA-binding CsgD family transcriptional regulator
MSARAWQGREPALTPEQAHRLREIGRLRAALPTTRELARELRISPDSVLAYMRRYRPKRYAD